MDFVEQASHTSFEVALFGANGRKENKQHKETPQKYGLVVTRDRRGFSLWLWEFFAAISGVVCGDSTNRTTSKLTSRCPRDPSADGNGDESDTDRQKQRSALTILRTHDTPC